MKRRETLTRIGSLAASAAIFPSRLLAQSDRPLRILLGFPSGGSIDVLARLLADKMKDDLKRPVIVENRPGASGRLAAELLKNTPPDGSTVMICPIVVTVLAPLVFTRLSYDPLVDMMPVAQLTTFNFALAVPADSPARNMQELVAHFKANPTNASMGSPGAGSLPHFFGLMIGRAAGVDVVHVPFQGGTPMQAALMGGQLPSGIDVELDSLQSLKSGKVRILATSGAKRSKVLPQIPTFAEQGLTAVQGSSWYGMYAPAKTAAADIDRVNKAVNAALAMPEIAERLLGLGLEVTGGSPADLLRIMEADTARWAPIIRASGFKAD